MSHGSDSDPFEGTEQYYAAHRPGYGDEAIAHLADRFGLDDAARVLDLGCGAGQLTVPISEYAGSVVAMDPNESMIAAARRRADDAGVTDVEWIVGSDADVDPELGPLRLTTMGRAFHWMDQEETLERLHDATEAGGGVALLDDPEWLTQGQRRWQEEVYDVVEAFLDGLPERTDPAEIEYENPWSELIAEFGFSDVEIEAFEHRREWDVESIVGYVFSLSFGSPKRFGDERAAFEAAVRDRLAEVGGGPFAQEARVRVVSGRV